MDSNDDLGPLRAEPFSSAVNKLEELLAQSGPAFLLGAGSSKCAGLPLTSELTDQVLKWQGLKPESRQVLEAVRSQFAGAAKANIEDYLSELIDQIAIAERRYSRGSALSTIDFAGSRYSATQFRDCVEDVKRGIASLVGAKATTSIHRRFLRAIHKPARPGKEQFGSPVDYLVLNYDTLIEDSLGLERVVFADGMEGGETAWWEPQSFDRVLLAARVIKLHGSISWRQLERDPMPRRLGGTAEDAAAKDRRIMIWPASTKYLETQLDPYAQLMNRARRALRPPMGSQRVLLTCGYSFCDAHINSEISASLRDSEGRLTLVVFWSEESLGEPLQTLLSDARVREQILVFGRRGFIHGSQSFSSADDLPWWKFEVLTRLLEAER